MSMTKNKPFPLWAKGESNARSSYSSGGTLAAQIQGEKEKREKCSNIHMITQWDENLNNTTHLSHSFLSENKRRCTQKKCHSTDALWSGTSKNRDVSTGPLAHPFARSLALLTHSLAPHCSLCWCATLCSFVHFPAHSLPSSWESDSMFHNALVLSHSAAGKQ